MAGAELAQLAKRASGNTHLASINVINEDTTMSRLLLDFIVCVGFFMALMFAAFMITAIM